MTSFSAELFNQPFSSKLQQRKNTSLTFGAGETPDKIRSVKQCTYKEDEITYNFNSDGFRSDELNNEFSPKILYVGCSFTEGVGLPVEHIWCSFLNEMISKEIGKSLPLLNLSVNGASAELLTRLIYTHVNNGFKPDLILMLLPSLFRNEIVITGKGYAKTFDYIQFAENSSHDLFDEKLFHSKYGKIITISQRLFETFRSLLFIKFFLEQKGIKLLFTTWDNLEFEKHLITPTTDGESFTSYFNELTNFPPNDLKSNVMPVKFIKNNNALQVKYFPYEVARDGIHPGPNSHFDFAEKVNTFLKDSGTLKWLIDKHGH